MFATSILPTENLKLWHLYTSLKTFPVEKISGLEWGSNPHTHISGVMLYTNWATKPLGGRNGRASHAPEM